MMREIGIHKEDKVTATERQSVHVGGAETQLSRTLENLDHFLSEDTLQVITKIEGSSYLELNSHFVGSIGTAVFHNDHFVRIATRHYRIESRRILALHHLIDHVYAQREILSLIVPI